MRQAEQLGNAGQLQEQRRFGSSPELLCPAWLPSTSCRDLEPRMEAMPGGSQCSVWSLTVTVVARLEGGRRLQAAPQGPVATVAVVEASIDVDWVLGVR